MGIGVPISKCKVITSNYQYNKCLHVFTLHRINQLWYAENTQ